MKLSVITVVLNCESMVGGCIDSVIAQEYAKLEHIVVDGSSTDSTQEIVNSYGNKIAKMITGPDQGIYDAMNKGLQVATGDVIGFLNADDIYPTPHVLSFVQQAFSNSNVDSCYGDLVYVSAKQTDKIVRYWRAGTYKPDNFFHGWMPPHPTFFVRRKVYEKYGLYNLALGTAADYELMLRFLLKHSIKTVYIPEVLVHMRVGGASNQSLRNRFRANRMDRMAWEENGLKPYPWTTYLKPLRKIPQWFVR